MSASQDRNLREVTRVLVVGLGSIGRRHARLLSERDDVELLLCDREPRFLAETADALTRPAAHRGTSYAAALEEGCDVVFLCTPTSCHATMAQEAIAAGYDLFVEKPLTSESASARAIVEAAAGAGCFLQVGYMMRFEEGLARLRALVMQGAIGEVVGARAMIGTYVTLLNARDSDRERVPYSLLLDYTHEFDYLHWILGPARSVSATAAQRGDLERRPRPNVVQAIIELESGALAQVHMDYVQHPQRRTLEIYGDRGTLLYDFMAGTLRRLACGDEPAEEVFEWGPVAARVDDMYRRQIEQLLISRRRGERPLVDGEQALWALEMAEAAMDSIQTGRRISVAASSSRGLERRAAIKSP